MTIQEIINRKFNFATPDMLEESRTVQALFVFDLPIFTAFDSNLNSIFADKWLVAINDGDNSDTDELYRDQIQTKTQDVAVAKIACRAKYNEVKYYVLKAFKNNKAVQQEFGLDDYDKARQSDIRLMEFMLRMYKVAVKYTDELIDPSVDYDDAKIAAIETLANNLTSKNTDQEVFIKGQLVATQNRVQLMNLVWESRTQVAAAAKIVYADNFAKYQQYLLPSSEAQPEDFAITGAVIDATTNQPIKGVRVRIVSLDIKLFTDAEGKYGLADNIPPATYTLDFEMLDYVAQTKTVTVTSADETITVNVNLTKS